MTETTLNLALALADGARQGDWLALALTVPWCLAFLAVIGGLLYGVGWTIWQVGRGGLRLARRVGR